jgi:hypothetical protein
MGVKLCFIHNLQEEHRFWAFENRVLRRIVELERAEITGG